MATRKSNNDKQYHSPKAQADKTRVSRSKTTRETMSAEKAINKYKLPFKQREYDEEVTVNDLSYTRVGLKEDSNITIGKKKR